MDFVDYLLNQEKKMKSLMLTDKERQAILAGMILGRMDTLVNECPLVSTEGAQEYLNRFCPLVELKLTKK